jgi:hypothetical protein
MKQGQDKKLEHLPPMGRRTIFVGKTQKNGFFSGIE